MTITDFLIKEYGFQKTSVRLKEGEIDYNKFTCVLRIHEIHYLYYSEDLKCFSIGLRYDNPKGEPGVKGIKKFWDYMMIPKVIRTEYDASLLIDAVVDQQYLNVITK